MKRTTKRIIYNVVIFGLLICGATIICMKFWHFGDVEYTDNATVCQHITPVNTRVQGYIREIRFEEYQEVHEGDTLAIIEDAEFQLRLAQAEADLANALAGKKVTHAGIATTTGTIAVNEAGIAEAKAQMDHAKREDARFAKLLNEDAVTQQQYDNVHTAYVAAQARYAQVSRGKATTELARTEQTVRLDQNSAGIKVAEANVRIARLNLSYCAIIATCNGVTGRKEIHVGQLVQPGQTLVTIVDSKDLWVQANYRESQLANIHVGSKVRITADAVPDVVFEGTVESLSDATGSAFSMIPTDNATGNFVKVESRLPVRISLKGNKPENLKLLKAGYNVECEIAY